VIPLATLQALRDVADKYEIALHCDGARIWHAHVADGVALAEYGALFDTLSVCLSKGLGAPVGSLIASDKAFLERAKIVRKRLGGWMRQAGILAAAGLYALKHNVARLAEDHALARSIAESIHGRNGVSCPPSEVETNIVYAQIDHPRFDAPKLSAALKEQGILAMPHTPRAVRFVTHLDVGSQDVERLVRALDRLLA